MADSVLEFARDLKRREDSERREQYSRAPAFHPGQTEFVIRKTTAVTMDPHVGNVIAADIHVRDGVIVDIEHSLSAPAIEIDGSNLVALPGQIVDHNRLVGANMPVSDRRFAHIQDIEPQDVYRMLRLALLDLVSAGFTCVHVDGTELGGDQAETAIMAQIDSGMRGRFICSADQRIADRAKLAVRELQQAWFADPADHLLDLGIIGDDGSPDPVLVTGLLSSVLPSLLIRDLTEPAEPNIGPAGRWRLDQRIDSLSPGERADLILVRDAMSPDGKTLRRFSAVDVEFVCIDGRIRKLNGVLTEPNEGLVRREGLDAIAHN